MRRGQAAKKLATIEYIVDHMAAWLTDAKLGDFSDTSEGLKALREKVVRKHRSKNEETAG